MSSDNLYELPKKGNAEQPAFFVEPTAYAKTDGVATLA